MEVILTKTITESDFETVYQGDYKELHSELIQEFFSTYPELYMKSAVGGSQVNVDTTITYTLTVQY